MSEQQKNTFENDPAKTEPKSKITLDSILREYDVKKAASAADVTFAADDPDLKAFKKELADLETGKEAPAEEVDDSDMKIVPPSPDADLPDEGPSAEEVSGESEAIGGDKTSIFDEISRHFREETEKENAPASDEPAEDPSKADSPETNTEKHEPSLIEQVTSEEENTKATGEKPADDVSDNADTREFPRAGIRTDNAKLIAAFDDDSYDLHTKKEKEKDAKKKKEADDGEPSEKSRFFDENGERIARQNPYESAKEEYTSADEGERFMGVLRKKLLGSCLALVGVFLLTLVSVYMEFAPVIGLPHARALEPGKLGTVFILADLQVLCFAMMIKLESLYKGAVYLFHGSPSIESVSFVVSLSAIAHAVITAVMQHTASSLSLFSSIACLSLLILSLADFYRARSEYMAFRVVSSKNDKFAIKDITASPEETSDGIRNFVPENSSILDVRRVGFVEKFFDRVCKQSSADKGIGVLMLVSFFAALAAGAVFYLLNGEVYDAIRGFFTVFLTANQSCLLLVSVLPEALGAGTASRKKCAFIGSNVCDEYENVSVVSFRDTEVFPPSDVKVTNIRTFGDTRIDNVIVTMARIFSTIGGPLSAVFSNSISGITLEEDSVQLVEVAPDGLWLRIDGLNTYLGTAPFMTESGFDAPTDSADDSFRQTGGGILYLAMGGRVLGKFYIKYALSPYFESVLRSLHNQDICARIKTLDPCINNDFIRASLRRPECLFSVVKANSPEEFEHEEEPLSSGVVCSSNEHSLIQSFLLIRPMRNAIQVNRRLGIAASVTGLVLSIFILLVSSRPIGTFLILMLHLLWIAAMSCYTRIRQKK